MDVLLLVRQCRRCRPRLSALAATLIIVVMLGTVAAPFASAATVDTEAWYVLVNRHSGKALDLYNLATDDGAATSSSLSGSWTPHLATESNPFARSNNVTFNGSAWTRDFSHGELIRAGNDQTLPLSPCQLQFLYQGQDPNASGDYIRLPWRMGLLTQTNSTC